MRPIWLLEAGVYGAEAEPLRAEIHRQGLDCHTIPHRALLNGPPLILDGQTLSPESCVIGYGTFPFARQITLHFPWIPGAWCHPENLDCTTYFAYFGQYLLNQPYVILPGVEAIRHQDWLFSIFGRDDRVFVRPTGCHKLFVGRIVTRDAFRTALSATRYDPSTLLVVAAPKTIEREWRLVVIENHVIAASQYAVAGERAIAVDCPSEVIAFAEDMLRNISWRPDPIFMMDICESQRELWLVELNGFSCSWLYQCDLSAVVRAASDLAERLSVKV